MSITVIKCAVDSAPVWQKLHLKCFLSHLFNFFLYFVTCVYIVEKSWSSFESPETDGFVTVCPSCSVPHLSHTSARLFTYNHSAAPVMPPGLHGVCTDIVLYKYVHLRNLLNKLTIALNLSVPVTAACPQTEKLLCNI